MSDDQGFGGQTDDDFGSEAQGAFLDDQRANVRACKPPSLGRLNGIGTGMYGRAAPADDGTYIKTLALSVFWIPVFPISQYLVSDAEGGGWYFHGKVPLSESVKAKRRGVLAVAALAVLMVAIFIFKAGTEADVHVVNGLDVALDVRLGEEALRVGPGEVRKVEVGAGALHVSAITPEGFVVDERDVDVPGRADAVIYNPLGAAPVFRRAVVYSHNATERETAAAEHVEPPTGEPWQVYEDTDFAFEPTPDQVEMPRGKNVVTKTLVDQAEDGWWRTASWMLERNRGQDAARLAVAAATVPPIDPHAVTVGLAYADLAADAKLAETLMQRASELAPENIDIALLHQTVLLRRRTHAEVAERVRALHAADPSEKNTLLLARLLPLEESRAVYDAGLSRMSDSTWLRASYAHSLASNGFFGEAVPHYRAVIDVDRHADMLADFGLALAASGEAAAALRGLGSRLGGMRPEDRDFRALTQYRRIQTLHPEVASNSVETLFPPRGSEAEYSAWWRAILFADAGDAEQARQVAEELDDEPRTLVEITLLAQTDLDAAVATARTLLADGVEPLVALGDLTKVQLACDFARTGDATVVDALFDGLSGFTRASVTRGLFDALPTVPGSEIRLSADVRAAFVRAAARRTDDPAARATLLARARALDPLHAVLPPAD